MIFAYAPDALIYDAGSNTWSLRPDYDPALHRVEIGFSDDDAFLDGDWTNGEVGDDANQTAEVFDVAGNLLYSGQVYSEQYFTIEQPDLTESWIDQIKTAGTIVGYVVSAPLEPGVTYTQLAVTNVGTPEQTGGSEERLQYTQASSVPCFGPGVRLLTDRGPVPAAWIRPGDRVVTRDHGLQPVVWVARRGVSAAELAANPGLRPVQVPSGALGDAGPAQGLVLSRQHRVLVTGPQVALHFGVDEALAPAFALAEAFGTVAPWRGGICYSHVMCARHEVLLADGVWVESLLAGDEALAAVTPRARQGLFDALGAGAADMRAARLCLKGYEATVLMAAQRRRRGTPRGVAQAA
ncbi:MAG: Hint domain-containing protein [Rhodobacteraceae bacterium]|nr:Hint domain-containing protein [Alphaproteobacteria bacterium]NNK66147.1 Hint domain-containing protein [Paracoccaceae bacterium]